MGYKPVKYAEEIGADALHPYFRLVNEQYVKAAHDAGIMVNPWTVNSEKAIDTMIELGVDGIITDFPDVVSGKLSRF